MTVTRLNGIKAAECAALPLLLAACARAPDEQLSFNESIQPILSENCYAPAMEREPEKFAPDYTPQEQQIGTIEAALGVRLLPRSQIKPDGLTLRCASAPQRCDDAATEKLVPVAPLIVDAELARSAVTDAGLETLARFENLRYLDLSRTSVTGAGVRKLVALQKLERLNLTADAVSDADVAALRRGKALKHIYAFSR